MRKYRSALDRDVIVLRTIESLIRLEGFSPTFREISQAIDGLGLSQVHGAVASLAGRGYLRRKAGRARTIALTKGHGSQDLARFADLANQVRLKRRKHMKITESIAGDGGEVPLSPAGS